MAKIFLTQNEADSLVNKDRYSNESFEILTKGNRKSLIYTAVFLPICTFLFLGLIVLFALTIAFPNVFGIILAAFIVGFSFLICLLLFLFLKYRLYLYLKKNVSELPSKKAH